MGSRYGAILSHLDVSWMGLDIGTSPKEVDRLARSADGILIATPTGLHFEHLNFYVGFRKPVFCEKPFTKNMSEMDAIADIYEGRSLTMALQYSELIDHNACGDSHYNYFRHGQDGLIWDCIQIVGLAKGRVELDQSSPVWDCRLNGQRLSVGDMDMAYVQNVKRWLSGESMEMGLIYDIHQKTSEFEWRRNNQGINRNSGSKHFN